MISILDLTTSDAVRAAIGIDEASGELDDQVFTDLRIADMLRLELAGWLPDTIEEIQADALMVLDDSDAAALALVALQSAATYWCAATFLLSGEISFATRQEDGQNRSVRQDFDADKLLEKLQSRYAYYKGKVTELLMPTATATLTNWFAGKATPTYDPVTNT
jgi:hypothetical protein